MEKCSSTGHLEATKNGCFLDAPKENSILTGIQREKRHDLGSQGDTVRGHWTTTHPRLAPTRTLQLSPGSLFCEPNCPAESVGHCPAMK